MSNKTIKRIILEELSNSLAKIFLAREAFNKKTFILLEKGNLIARFYKDTIIEGSEDFKIELIQSGYIDESMYIIINGEEDYIINVDIDYQSCDSLAEEVAETINKLILK